MPDPSPAARPTPAPRGRLARRLLLATASAVVLPSWVEVTVATFGLAPPREPPIQIWNPDQDAALATAEGEFRAHPRWLWEPRPGAMVHGEPINDAGYRGPERPRSRAGGAALRIATLGDSSTYGFGVAEDECWSRRLEATLRGHGVDAEVLNFGVVGFTIRKGLELYRGRISEYRPDVVVAAFGAVNDSVTASPPMTDREKIRRLSDPWMAARVRLGRFATFRWLEASLRFAGDGEPETTGDAGDPAAVARVPLDDFRDALLELDRAVARDGGRLLVVIPPRRIVAEELVPASTPYPAVALQTATDAGIPSVDVLTPFRAVERQQLAAAGVDASSPVGDAQTLFLDPWHPTAAGHDAYGTHVALGLLRGGLLPGLEADASNGEPADGEGPR